MADYAPPAGPPPPKVPAGWKAVWNDQYKEWFYVNTFTKKSQWEAPTEPVYGPPGDSPPPGAPPGYNSSSARATTDGKSNNPFLQSTAGTNASATGARSSNDIGEDERLARQLQDEENARAGTGSRGAANDFYGSSSSPNTYPPQDSSTPYSQQDLPPRDSGKRGLFSKLSSKLGSGGSSSRPYGSGGYGGGGYGGYQQQYPPQGYPQQGYGPPGGYGGYAGGYAPQQGGYYQQQQQPARSHGLGAGGGAALGLGAGLIGGALIMDGIDNSEQNSYDQGYQNGADQGGDDGGGGGDDGGGGDFGGGDF